MSGACWLSLPAVFQHALGCNKQYVGWYGQPILQNIPGATLQVGYASTFWGLVNELGNVGAGASGGALFDPNNHAVGSATLAVRSAGVPRYLQNSTVSISSRGVLAVAGCRPCDPPLRLV